MFSPILKPIPYNLQPTTYNLQPLKISRINTAFDQEINDSISEICFNENLPAPKNIPTLDSKTYFEFDDRICILQNRIKGDLFSGSIKELKSAARMHAKFLTVMNNSNLSKQITSKQDDYKYSFEEINIIESKIKESNNSEFDQYAKHFLELINNKFGILRNYKSLELRKSIGHFDWHGHNLLFKDGEVIGLLDFDLVRNDYLITDFALGMLKFSRVFGKFTDNKLDQGNSIENRARIYYEIFNKILTLDSYELDCIGDVLFNEIARKVIYILKRHYIKNDFGSDFDLKKQIIQLHEINFIKL